MDIKAMFGHDLDETLHAVVSEELDRLDYEEIMNNSVEGLNRSLEENVISKLPDLQKLFDDIEKDVAKLEMDSKTLKKEFAKRDTSEVIDVDDDSQELANSSTDSSVQIQHSVSLKSADTSPRQMELRKISPRVKYTFSSKLGHENLAIGLPVLALHKEEWKKATVIDIQNHRDKIKYKVRFAASNGKSLLQFNHLACIETTDMFDLSQITAGSRVAANFKDEGIYAGVVAEACSKVMNRNRLLIFFDDGYAMYCSPKQVYLVYGPQTEVWNDIGQQATADYIKDYLSTPVRQMLSMREGQNLKVEFHGDWHWARCLRVDSSLVEVLYLSDSSKEWIYRGSMRLEPLYRQRHMKMRDKRSSAGENRIARAHTGVRKARIEYTTIDLTRDSPPSESKQSARRNSQDQLSDNSSVAQGDAAIDVKREGRWQAPWERSLSKQKPAGNQSGEITRLPKSYSEMQGGVDVASYLYNRLEQKKHKDSSASGDSRQRSLSSDCANSSSKPKRLIGKRSSLTDERASLISKTSALYNPHKCNSQCVAPFLMSQSLKGVNPLLKPLVLGWTREISRVKHYNQRTAFHIYYRAPCGRACRIMDDVERYFLECGISTLDLSDFSFDHTVKVQSNIEIKPRDAKFFIEDCSNGKEDIPISCVNEISFESPPKMPYTKHRIPGKGVKINTSPDFMACCDCTDNCRDRSKCACQMLTVQATSCCRGGKIKADAGYQDKRLYTFLPTGIYECNSRCRCNSQCKNRVVQLGLRCRLQMFKTQKKGWGIRCLDDIPQGTFVCIYTGKIQTEANANSEGLKNGDEYLAELDHIEVAENQKLEYNQDESSGIDSLSDDNMSDDEGVYRGSKNSPVDKVVQKNDDTTDTEDEYMEQGCVKVTLRRESGTTWSVSSDVRREQDLDKRPDPKPFATGSRKLGYSSDPEVSPGLIPDAVRRRRGRHMVARSNPPPRDSSNDSDTDIQQCAVFRQPNLLDDDDTTDTDSDTEVSMFRHSSIAVKSTLPPEKVHQTKIKKKPSSSDSDSDEEEINRTRRYFGPEGTFIIDAKQTGNLGRHLNHSCTPNLMVQNVFIDTHDLRFPWVAFFANSTIRSGTELTWDYNYEIGSVPDRIIHCYCGSTKCRKRLL